MHIYLITGPQWIPQAYFDCHYRPIILQKIQEGSNFILGAAEGVDFFAQLLLSNEISENQHADRVTICNKGQKDGRMSQKFNLLNGFEKYPDRDHYMSKQADEVICIVPQYGGGTTGVLIPLLCFGGKMSFGEAKNVLEIIRKHSEPYSKELESQVSEVYKNRYLSHHPEDNL